MYMYSAQVLMGLRQYTYVTAALFGYCLHCCHGTFFTRCNRQQDRLRKSLVSRGSTCATVKLPAEAVMYVGKSCPAFEVGVWAGPDWEDAGLECNNLQSRCGIGGTMNPCRPIGDIDANAYPK